MTHAQIVGLGVRLFAIWLALYALGGLSQLWAFIERDFKDPGGAGVVMALAALMGFVAVLLWVFPLSVARKLIPRTALDQPTTLPLEHVEAAGFCLMGLWVLASAIPSAFMWAVFVYQSTRPQSMFSLEPRNYATIAYVLVQLVIGLWLLFGARGLLRVLRWARTAGTDAS